ncbi:MAG: DOMON domain-containing protein [Bacteroidota bacterium]
MKILAALTLLLAICVTHLSAQQHHSVEKNGMKVSYQVHDDHIEFTLNAPTRGWVAIGLHAKDQLSGSTFLIGRIVEGEVEVVDFYTMRPGLVPKIEELGGKTAVNHFLGKEKGKRTEISFNLARFPNSEFHQQLESGKTFFMHMAYSQEDDFAHHSVMRDKVLVKF